MEFALILPLLAVIVFGTVDLGRAYSTKNQLTNMAREGSFVARAGVCPAARMTKVLDAAAAENSDLAGDVDTIKVVAGTDPDSPQIVCGTTPPEITTVVQLEMELITPFVGAVIGGSSVTLTGTSTVSPR